MVIWENGLIRKIRLISEFMTSQTNNCNTHTDQRRNSNQGMAFDQLIEHNMKHFFFEKSHTQNAVELLFPDPFLKNQN